MLAETFDSASDLIASPRTRDRKPFLWPIPGLVVKDLFSFLPAPFDLIAAAVVTGSVLISFIAALASVFVWPSTGLAAFRIAWALPASATGACHR